MICNECKDEIEGELVPNMQRHWGAKHSKRYREIERAIKDGFTLSTLGLGHQTWRETSKRIDYSEAADGLVRYRRNMHRGPIKLAEE